MHSDHVYPRAVPQAIYSIFYLFFFHFLCTGKLMQRSAFRSDGKLFRFQKMRSVYVYVYGHEYARAHTRAPPPPGSSTSLYRSPHFLASDTFQDPLWVPEVTCRYSTESYTHTVSSDTSEWVVYTVWIHCTKGWCISRAGQMRRRKISSRLIPSCQIQWSLSILILHPFSVLFNHHRHSLLNFVCIFSFSHLLLMQRF